MPEPPRRARFQIHLSTAIVMMFVAGGLIWANFDRRVYHEKYGMTVNDWGLAFEREQNTTVIEYGYPCTAVWLIINDDGHSPHDWSILSKWRASIDAIIALMILLAVWFICEWLIRRRAARKRG